MTTSKDETDEITSRRKIDRDRFQIRYLCPIYKHKRKLQANRRWKNMTTHKRKMKSLGKKIDYHKKIAMVIECDNNNKQAEVVFLASASRLGSLKFDMKDICNVKDVKQVEDT